MSSRLKTRFIPIWKEAPFLRLLLPVAFGIILQWYLPVPQQLLLIGTATCFCLCIMLFVLRYRYDVRFGIGFYSLLLLAGCWLTILKDPRNFSDHLSKQYDPSQTIVATLQEPLIEKPKSYKAEASVQLLDSLGNLKTVEGNILIYFAKSKSKPALDYGSVVVFKHSLNAIRNSGNPGAFDYERYAAFHGLYYQVFLNNQDYQIASFKSVNRFKGLLFTTRQYVIKTFQSFIPGNTESGLAEALLVGYKEDLDKSLVEQYANTGVVHIIAISGMHLGLIYGLLWMLFKPVRNRRYGKFISAVCIIAALWFFTLLTGAAPSISRSAIMFTIIVAGTTFSKRSSIYNALFLSALVLLLFNPFNLWDVGFQLSYAALLSIAVLGKPITNWWHPKNLILSKTWQLIAVTLAAQVFTLPFVLYHFHQFPLSFLFANLVAVPLSGVILYLLIALLFVSWIPFVGKLLGWCAFASIQIMNNWVSLIHNLPFSRIGDIYFTIPQTILLIILIASMCWWLLRRNATAFLTALIMLCSLMILKQIQWQKSLQQRKLVVYNVPQLSAIDIIQGNQYSFYGDTALQRTDFLQNFHLLPGRIQYQASFRQNISKANPPTLHKVQLGGKTFLVADKPIRYKGFTQEKFHYLIVSGACYNNPFTLLTHVKCDRIILDGSNNRRRILQWKNAADSLHLPLYSVPDQGAFIVDF